MRAVTHSPSHGAPARRHGPGPQSSADCWPTPAAQEGHNHALLADCPLGSQGSWRAVAGGQQGLGSGFPVAANGHDLLLTLQPCAEPLPLARGGGSAPHRQAGPVGSPCHALYVQTTGSRPTPDFFLLCSTLAPPTPSDVFRQTTATTGAGMKNRPVNQDACPEPKGARRPPCFCCLVGSFLLSFF